MEYPLAQYLFLEFAELLLDLHHAAVQRPRSFWGSWVLGFAVVAVLLLAPARAWNRGANSG